MTKRFKIYLSAICLAILIAIGTMVISCTHFSLKVGELKDAEVVLDNTAKE